MKSKGLLVAELVSFCLVVVTSFIIYLTLPNIIAAWETATGKSPITVKVVMTPEFLPLTADHTLRALLASTDDQTGMQVQELLAYAAKEKNTNFNLADGKSVDLEKVIDKKINFLVPEMDYNIVVIDKNIDIGNKKFASKFRSSSTITLPDLSRAEVILYLG
jgi:hypothetical protein